jgi:glycosyltransferase involved in cell wall biosynthesis
MSVADALRGCPVDLIHLQYGGCIEETPVAARLAKMPRILGTFHVDSTYNLEGQGDGVADRTLEHIAVHSLDRAIAVSHATKASWAKRAHYPSPRIVTVHNGVNLQRFARRIDRATARAGLGLPDNGAIIVGGVGALDTRKGFIYLIEAVSLLVNRGAPVILALAGVGPLRLQLELHATRYGIRDRVRFLGHCSDVQVAYDSFDIVALSSLCEALPFVALEAMAHELPVVATAVAGVPEIITPETGMLVPPRDPAALAAALEVLVRSASRRTSMGKAGRVRVCRQFDESKMVRATIDVYREMLRPTTFLRRPFAGTVS